VASKSSGAVVGRRRKKHEFFHQKANNRKKKMHSRLVKDDGSVCEKPAELERHTVQFFSNLYTSEGTIGNEEVLSHMSIVKSR
jgi:hypothetical protein